mgnify:CR=1 FL=1
MAAYFSNFPSVRYKTDTVDAKAKNILLRGILRDQAKKLLLETVSINPGDRPDHVGHLLYGNSEDDFLFFILNDIVDPYYEWYLSDNQFKEFLFNKYGTEMDGPHHQGLQVHHRWQVPHQGRGASCT